MPSPPPLAVPPCWYEPCPGSPRLWQVLNARFKADVTREAPPGAERADARASLAESVDAGPLGAGVLIHQLDGYQDPSRPWAPCPADLDAPGVPDECEYEHIAQRRQRVSTSLIYAQLRSKDESIPTFSYDGGVVLRPQFARPLCGYGADGSIDASKEIACPRGHARGGTPAPTPSPALKSSECVPGCSLPKAVQDSLPLRGGPDWCSKANPHDEGEWNWCGINWSRSGVRPWRPSDFRGRGGLLDIFARNGLPFLGIGPGQADKGKAIDKDKDKRSFKGYNEVVVDSDAWLDHLPWSVEAIFYVECLDGRDKANLKYSNMASASDTCGEAEDRAREMHAAFLRAYPQIQPAAFPLLRLKADDWEHPFRRQS